MIRDSQKRPHERLDVWQDAMQLVESIHRFTASFPDGERFGLVSRMRRAVVGVPSNIAEGAARRSRTEHLRYLSIARGSLSELDTHVTIAQRLGFSSISPELDELLQRTFARLNALIGALESRLADSSACQSQIPYPQSPPSHAR